MNIPFAGSLTKEEFKDVIKLGQRPVSKKSAMFIDVWLIFLVLGLGLMGIGFRMMFTTENTGGGIAIAVVGMICFVLGLKLRTAIDQAWEQYRKTDIHREGSLTDESLELRTSTGHSQLLWTGFTGYGEYHNVLVLFQGQVGYPFPARFFQTESDWQEFRKFAWGKFPISHQVTSGLNLSSNWFIWLLLIISIVALLILKDAK